VLLTLAKLSKRAINTLFPFDSGMTWVVVGQHASTPTANGRVAYDIDKTLSSSCQKTTMSAALPIQKSLSVVRVATSLAGSESDVVLQDFCSAVVGHFASQLSQGETGSTPAGFIPFQVSNKYFAASIALSYSDIVKVDGGFVDSPYHELKPEIHPPDSNNGNQASNTEPTTHESSDASCPTPDNWHEDGVILLFESFPRTLPAPLLTPQRSVRLTSSSSFNALDSVHERLIQHLPSAGDLLRLCIGVCYGTTSSDEVDCAATSDAVDKQHEDEYARRILWCLDRGYEYVEVDLSEHGQAQGHDDRDKDGFARVMEAMAGTVWTSAVMKQSRAAPVSHNPTQLERPAASEQRQTDNHHDAAYIPPDPPTCTPTPLSDKNDTQPLDFPSSTDPDERLMDRFEVALGQAARIRDLSKSGELSDQERRDRAGDAAVLLMNLLGQMGYDDDDDDASSDGSDQDEPSALASECPIDV
jgi:hypothetical protein